ncbi:hypothetical protein [Microterricola viridarii]|uniref:hypothetical protein n=1 Tax=Microterricola viridarii TaxID=412690 RepID=UPI001365F7A7|nr:hypothetical protein [Microterricola viridarii]
MHCREARLAAIPDGPALAQDFEGIDQVPGAFEAVLNGSSTGRVLVSMPAPHHN